jgi:glycerophosphoryl diester phosphodiesterase
VRLGCGGVAIEHRILGAAGIARARAAGLEVAAWTLTNGADERRVAELGVDVAIVEGEAIGREGRRAE